jgi:hypothetical protein
MPIAITNPSSPSLVGESGTPLSYDFDVSGGTPPYTWGVSDDSPSWLSITPSGVLSGTPIAAGTFSATVQVTDSAGPQGVATNTFDLVIAYGAIIQGTLRLDTSDGPFAARKVYLYDYTTGAKVAETTSDGTTGVWQFAQVAPGEYFVVGAAQGDDLNIPRDFDALGVITVT